jgi:hypothetical protein
MLETLKTTLSNNIPRGADKSISTNLLRECFDSIIVDLERLTRGLEFIGIATPSTVPAAPVEKVFYFALTAGTYTNFSGVVIAENELCIISWNGSTWAKSVLLDLSEYALLFTEIDSTTAKVNGTAMYANTFFRDSKTVGKKLLAIGDNLTTANVWQQKVGSLLGMTVSNQAIAGGGLLHFVDGGTIGGVTLTALDATKVTDIDTIVVLGPYNNRVLMAAATIGVKTDMYPTQETLWGQMNYTFKRIYEELVSAGNTNCKIFFAGIHATGANAYIGANAYQEYPAESEATGYDFAEKLKEICKWNGIEYIDLFNNSGINSYTWNIYQASPQPNSNTYIGYVGGRASGISDPFPDLVTLEASVASHGFENDDRATVEGYEGYYSFSEGVFTAVPIANYFPWLTDQLLCNTAGYNLLGNFIASCINKFFNE